MAIYGFITLGASICYGLFLQDLLVSQPEKSRILEYKLSQLIIKQLVILRAIPQFNKANTIRNMI